MTIPGHFQVIKVFQTSGYHVDRWVLSSFRVTYPPPSPDPNAGPLTNAGDADDDAPAPNTVEPNCDWLPNTGPLPNDEPPPNVAAPPNAGLLPKAAAPPNAGGEPNWPVTDKTSCHSKDSQRPHHCYHHFMAIITNNLHWVTLPFKNRRILSQRSFTACKVCIQVCLLFPVSLLVAWHVITQDVITQ